MRRTIATLGLAALLAQGLPTQGHAASGDFSGKSITVVVAFAAGGPVDLFARLIAAHVGRHIPGDPNIVVQNMPGAGGVVASNHLYHIAKKDGSVFGVTISPFTNQYVGTG
jgi:tripartite-type tricarboxylate transporter receptor subunit TctC